MKNGSTVSTGQRVLAGMAILALAGCATAPAAPTGMDHAADLGPAPDAVAAEAPQDDAMRHDAPAMEGGHAERNHEGGRAEAHSAEHDHGDQIAAAATGIDRIIEVTAIDIDFDPGTIAVQAGETIRFVITNEGAIDHEFVVGDRAAQLAHAEQMAAMGREMDHAHTSAVRVAPGETAELVWTFEAGPELQFACHVPGHYRAGMWGNIEIVS